MKKLIQACWTERSLDYEKKLQSFTATPLAEKTDCPLLKNYLDIQSRTSCLLTIVPNGSVLLLQLSSSDMTIWNYLQLFITSIPTN